MGPAVVRGIMSGQVMDDELILRKRVAFFYGCFVNYYYPELGEATLEVLAKNGVEVAVPDQVCCGLPMVGKGNVKEASQNMEFNTRQVGRLVIEGYALISTCPSCGLFIKEYYPRMLGGKEAQQVSQSVYHITEYLMSLHRMGQLATDFLTMNRTVFYHTPCHLRAQQNVRQVGNPTVELLRLIPGVTVTEVSEECCGMAGSYGYQKVNYERSQGIAARLFMRIKETPTDRIVDDCGGCRLQIEAGTGRQVDHPIILLHEAYGLAKTRESLGASRDPGPMSSR